LVFWPQDFIYLRYAHHLRTAVISVMLWQAAYFAAMPAAVVYTEIFMWIERKIEGDRLARIKLDKMPCPSCAELHLSGKTYRLDCLCVVDRLYLRRLLHAIRH